MMEKNLTSTLWYYIPTSTRPPVFLIFSDRPCGKNLRHNVDISDAR